MPITFVDADLLFCALQVAGVYVLSMFTVPVQTALWILLSITGYLTRPRPPRRAVRKFDKTGIVSSQPDRMVCFALF